MCVCACLSACFDSRIKIWPVAVLVYGGLICNLQLGIYIVRSSCIQDCHSLSLILTSSSSSSSSFLPSSDRMELHSNRTYSIYYDSSISKTPILIWLIDTFIQLLFEVKQVRWNDTAGNSNNSTNYQHQRQQQGEWANKNGDKSRTIKQHIKCTAFP